MTSIAQLITVNVNDLHDTNSPPTDLSINKSTFDPSITAAEVVGVFTTTDGDDTEFVYELIDNDGGENNDMFVLTGDKLHLKDNRGLSGLTTFSIRVRSTDPSGQTVEKVFAILKSGYEQANIAIPSTFSPNGDGINDTWVAGDLRFFNDVRVEIFDRSGVPLFQTIDPEQGWDGRAHGGAILDGPFFYIIHIIDQHVTRKGILISLK